MGMSVNEVTIVGRVGKDPTVRYTGNGTAVANLTVATDETFKDRSGEKQKKTEWHSVVVWQKTAEFVAQYVGVGTLVYVRGKLQTRKWTDKRTNTDRYTTDVVATDFKIFADPKKSGNSGKPAASASSQGSARPAQRRQEPQDQGPDGGSDFSAEDDNPFA